MSTLNYNINWEYHKTLSSKYNIFIAHVLLSYFLRVSNFQHDVSGDELFGHPQVHVKSDEIVSVVCFQVTSNCQIPPEEGWKMYWLKNEDKKS